MMDNTMKYKDYWGSVEYSAEDNCLYGKIIGIDDLISYEGESIAELRQEFCDAVDEYIAFCKEKGKEPEKTYQGMIRVHIAPTLHRQAAICAKAHGETLEHFVEEAIQRRVQEA